MIDEGIEKGMEKVMERVIEKVIEEIIEEGMEKGIEKERAEIALRMLEQNMELQLIAQITKLSIQQSQRLKKLEDLREAMKGKNTAKTRMKLWKLSQDEVLREYLEAINIKERNGISAENLARREGQLEGIVQGLKEGIEEGIAEVILKLLNTGMSAEKISKVTGFSKEEICKLQEKSKR